MPEPRLTGKKIAILMESDFYEPEILYYKSRFAEEGAEVHFVTRLWGQPGLTFQGHEHRMPFYVDKSFEDMSDEDLRSYAAVIVPAGFVSDRLRYTPDVTQPSPAVAFLRRAFAEPSIVKGVICHGLWLVAWAPDLVRGRRLTTHNNLFADAMNMGALYENEDVVVDGDLVTGRTGGHHAVFARRLMDEIVARSAAKEAVNA
ncbi:DJ-1/PfpI family protein [Deinococcus yavapaiensis]|uniref:Protease I n=1 Tax=Deinococcus yavapaiensis KR-236 TaxID=694435 RepID=A0A318S749_9DEIO|nr:DJ-1/PfpI family protein [Deinococcus yavapaiensis]PYE54796.1 protease I [Deinococcus yavapaiensis KR-236]